MKNILFVFVILIFLSSCSQPKDIIFPDGKTRTISPYGIFNMEDKNPDISYKISTKDVVVSIIFCETIIAPIISAGFNLWEPVGLAEK